MRSLFRRRTSRFSSLCAVALLCVSACGGSGALKDQARDALPSKDTLTTGSPQTAAAGTSSSTNAQDLAVGDASFWFGATVATATLFNGGTEWVLGVLEKVTDQEPTQCDANSCTWGPGYGAFDANTAKLVVTRNGDHFDYTLSAEPRTRPGSGFVNVLTGSATPGGSRHHGTGSFTIDFDAAAKLDQPHQDTGMLRATYGNVGPAHLDVIFTNARDFSNPAQRNNVVYSYAAGGTGGGDLDVATHDLLHDNRFSFHSRWKNDGQGRADAAAQGHDATSGTPYDVRLSQCWGGPPFHTLFFTSTLKAELPPVGGADVGVETSCAFAPAAFSSKTAP